MPKHKTNRRTLTLGERRADRRNRIAASKLLAKEEREIEAWLNRSTEDLDREMAEFQGSRAMSMGLSAEAWGF